MTSTIKNPPSSASLIESFSSLPDPRIARKREHKLIDILVIGFCSTLAGGEGFNDMELFGHSKQEWFKKFLELPNGIPSHDTFNRVFQALDPEAFLECFLHWTQGLRTALSGEVVAVDGKALRRALNKGRKDALPYIVSAWASDNSLVLGQLKVQDKSNEITAIPELLRALELSGCIVTIDAMGCQKKIAREIINADADYVLALKGNHETVHDEVSCFMNDEIDRRQKQPDAVAELDYHQMIEKDHGRIEIRRFWQSTHTEWFADRNLWEGLASFGAVESVRDINGVVSIERRYYLSSLPLDVRAFAKASRQHWGVENNVHWLLDVVFKEDQSRARQGHAAQNLATLRRLALNVIKRAKHKCSMRQKVKKAGWCNEFLLTLLGIDPS